MSERDFNEIFSKQLKYYLNKYEMTQTELANKLGVGTTSIYNWCNGIKTPRMDKIDKMCEIFHIKRSDLMIDNDSIVIPTKKNVVSVKILRHISACETHETLDNIIDTEKISEEMANTGDFFGLKICDDSMGSKIEVGDVVIIRRQEDAESGDIVIVSVGKEDATCKRLRKYRDGIELVSSNPSYEPMFFSNEDIIKKPVTIIGKVVELRCKF